MTVTREAEQCQDGGQGTKEDSLLRATFSFHSKFTGKQRFFSTRRDKYTKQYSN